MSSRVKFNVEEFWDDLLAFIEEKRVLPVIGAQLIRVENGEGVPLYRVVAERLLNKYGFSPTDLPGGEVLRQHHEINDAVCVLASSGHRIKDLYRPLNEILAKVLAQPTLNVEPLRQLA